ncbi:hypothetical protein GN156_13315 [bacterium LRH843]|nr:hypothetical protein [bacterium LRH843]
MNDKRFEVIYKQGKLETFKIIRDNETGVLYMMNQSGYGGGITVMVDQEGKPLVDEGFRK